MPKYNFLLLFLVCTCFSSWAQNEKFPGKLDWGKKIKAPKRSYLSKILLHDSTGFYAVRETTAGLGGAPTKVYLEYYNDDKKLKKSNKIDLKYSGKKRTYEDLLQLDGNLYLMTSFFNRAKERNYLFVQEVNPRSLRARKKITKIGEIPTRGLTGTGLFDFSLSRDSTKILLYNQLPTGKKDPESFAFRVFNDQFEEMWSKDIILPYNNNQFTVEEYRVDNEGNVYLLGVIFMDKSKRRRQGKANYQYVILAYENNGEDFTEYKVEENEKFITDLTFRIGNRGQLICAGFYSEKRSYSIKGTCYFKIDRKNKEVLDRNFRAFDFEFLTEYFSDRKKRKAQRNKEKGRMDKVPEMYNYALNDLILRSDGGAVLVAEQFYIYEQDDFNTFGANRFGFNNNMRIITYYNYNDIIVVNIKPTGEIEWATRIPKKQTTTDDGGYYSSYAMSIIRDKIYFVYNDNGRNFNLDGKTSSKFYNFNGRSSVIALAQISKDGSLQTFPMASNRDVGTLARPKVCKQIGKREMLIYGERGRNYKLGSLTFNR